jgi:hypothetical protein
MRGVTSETCSTVAQFVRVTNAYHCDLAVYFFTCRLTLFSFLPPLDYVFVRGTKRKYCYVIDEFLSLTSPEAQRYD